MTMPMTMLRVALALGMALAAQAKPTRAALKKAGRHFDRAEKLYQLGDYKKAIVEFEKAYALTEDPVVLLNVAQATRKQFDLDGDLEKLGRARELYRTFLREAPRDSPFRGEAESLLKKVELRLAEPSAPKSGEDAVAEARRLAEQKEYEEALAKLDAALMAPNNSHDALIEIYKLRGILSAQRGREDDAQKSFRALLGVDPGHSLAETTDPAVTRAFAAALSYWAGKEPPRLAVVLPSRAEPGEPLVLDAKVRSDPLQMVSGIEVLLRRPGEKEFSRLKGTTVPETLVVPPGAEIVVMGVDPHGGAVCLEGTPGSPLRIVIGEPVAPEPSAAIVQPAPEPVTPWYQRPMTWGIVGAGAAVVGGGIAAYLLTRDDHTSNSCTVEPCTPPIPE